MKKVIVLIGMFTILTLLKLQFSNAEVTHFFDTQFDTNQINNTVNTIYKDNTDLYIGGDFTDVDGNAFNYLAKWDGNNWSTLWPGIASKTWWKVNIIHKSNGIIYAGGDFDKISFTTVNNIAQWNWFSWTSLNQWVNWPVNAIYEYNNNIYVGGDFIEASSTTVNYIAIWNGSSWSSIWAWLNGAVNSMTVRNDRLIVWWAFTQASWTTLNYIAQWDGNNWIAMDNGFNAPVKTLEVTKDNTLYAGGEFTQSNGVNMNYIAKWNWSNWEALWTGTTNYVNIIKEWYNDDLYVGGDFNIWETFVSDYLARWDGNNWLSVDGLNTTTNGAVNAINKYNWDMYIGGNFKKEWYSNDYYFAKYYGEYLTYIVWYEDKWWNNVDIFPNGPIINPLWDQVNLSEWWDYVVKVNYKNELNRATNQDDKLDFFGERSTNGVEPSEYGGFDFNIKVFKTNPDHWNIPESTLDSWLVAYYSFDAGDATDDSGNWNTGTINSPIWTGNGKIGGAYNFDGIDDYISVDSNASLETMTDITISAWIKTDPTISSIGTIVRRDPSGWDRTIYDMDLSSNGFLRITFMGTDSSDFTNQQSSINDLRDNNWHHVVIVRDSDNQKAYGYVDWSREINTTDIADWSFDGDDTPIYIWDWSIDSTHRWFKWLIDEIRIYNRALSSGEVLELYNLN